MTDFRREVRVLPAFNKRNTDPKKDYGIGSARIWFALIGPEAAVTYSVSTGMYLPTVSEELERTSHRFNPFAPTAGPISVHSPYPLYEGHTADECEYLPGGKCYSDGAFCAGSDLLTVMLRDGDEAVWSTLEEWHAHLLEKRPVAAPS